MIGCLLNSKIQVFELLVEEAHPRLHNIIVGFMLSRSDSKVIRPVHVENMLFLVMKEVDSWFGCDFLKMYHEGVALEET